MTLKQGILTTLSIDETRDLLIRHKKKRQPRVSEAASFTNPPVRVDYAMFIPVT